ncbi:unnamed protein product [Allacma fusca]|uniref:PLD phosphodiesterase domain-containing protein n=1 Tax=Allacma fusca TaxID=39272 RepID=A0A8J2PWE5_9HEXA|nr:unnamed protein product [Allacma fusca]
MTPAEAADVLCFVLQYKYLRLEYLNVRCVKYSAYLLCPYSAVEASGKLDFGELELELYDSRYMLRGAKDQKWAGKWCKPSCIPISIILVLIILVVVLSLLDHKWEDERRQHEQLLANEWVQCRTTCKLSLVESIPEGLVFNETLPHMQTHDAWVRLIDLAEEKIEIGSFYWFLQGNNESTSDKGKDIFKRLMEAGKERKIKINIAQSMDDPKQPNKDSAELQAAGAATVRTLNFTRLIGAGVLHTKMWVVDRKHAYIGSANFDWRSLTQVKELGVLITNCSCIGKDLGKIFDVYWDLGLNDSKIPDVWDPSYQTLYGRENPMNISFNSTEYKAYLSSSPSAFCPKGRTPDIDAIKDVIDNATEYVHIAVMDYFPVTLYTEPPQYWPEIDDRLRSAAINRKVKVRLLMAKWNHTRSNAYRFLHSLADLSSTYPWVDIDVKMFIVPANAEQQKIPFARVNHSKFMVTDKTAYIGTSNWSADYFINTAGVGFVTTPESNQANSSNIQQQLAHIFERDWNSSYAHPLQEFLPS